MAYCMDIKRTCHIGRRQSDKVLCLMRRDKESVHFNLSLPSDHIVSDWPSLSGNRCINIILRVYNMLRRRGFVKTSYYWLYHTYRRIMVKGAKRFVLNCSEVYSTRLHGMILCSMLGVKVHAIDNSYGKLSAFYNTWLKDVECVSLYER